MFENECIKYAEYTELMKKTQEYILEYIDNENNQEEIYQNLVTSIGNHAFYYCKSLIQITIPESIKSIGNNAFGFCSSFRQISIPASVKSFGTKIFEGDIKNIPKNLFEECFSLKHVTIKSLSTSIEDGVFRNCTSLESVSINSTVSLIKKICFLFMHVIN